MERTGKREGVEGVREMRESQRTSSPVLSLACSLVVKSGTIQKKNGETRDSGRKKGSSHMINIEVDFDERVRVDYLFISLF